MLEVIILILVGILGVLIGYIVNNRKERLRTEQRCLEISRASKVQDSKIEMRDDIIVKQSELIISKDKAFEEIIQRLQNNSYDNDKVCKRKIKELAQSALELALK